MKRCSMIIVKIMITILTEVVERVFYLDHLKKWELPKLVNHEPNYPKAIHKLELYPEKFYTKCVSEFDNDALQKIQPTPHNDPYNTFLQFNKGVLIPIRCDSKSINSGTKHE